MHNLLIVISNIIMASSFVYGLFCYRYLDRPYRTAMIQSILGLAANIGGTLYLKTHTNNTVIVNAYLLCDVWVMVALAITLKPERTFIQLVIGCAAICTGIELVCISKMGVNTFANWAYVSNSIFYSVIFLFFFLRLLFGNNNTSVTDRPLFWLCLSILVYYDSSVPLFGFVNYLIKYHPAIASKTFIINELLIILRYSFLIVAFKLHRRQNMAITNPINT